MLNGYSQRPQAWIELIGAGGVRLRWTGKAGTQYQLQTSEDLREWTNVGEPLTSDGTEQEIEFTPDGTSPQFFRLTQI